MGDAGAGRKGLTTLGNMLIRVWGAALMPQQSMASPIFASGMVLT